MSGGDGDDADSDTTEAARQAAVASFLPKFQSAVDGLPGLHTLVSRPMPPRHVIFAGPDNNGYLLSAGVLQAYQAEGGSPPPPPPQTNDGFLLFLAPTMARPISTATQLR